MKVSRNIFLIILSIIVHSSFSKTITAQQFAEQDWYRIYGYTLGNQHPGFLTEGRDIITDEKGFIYITGACYNAVSSNSSVDFMTVKYNQTGDTIWTVKYSSAGSYNDYALHIKLDKLGNVYVSGYSRIGAEIRLATVKYNSQGVQQWAVATDFYVLASAEGGLEIDNSGNVYVCGGNGAVIKYNSQGIQQWLKRPAQFFNAMTLDNDNNIIVTGQPYTIKYSVNGDSLWSIQNPPSINCVGVPPATIMFDVINDNSNNIYVTGRYQFNCDTRLDVLTRKYSPTGQILWAKTYSDTNIQTGVSLALDNSNNVYVGASGFVAPIIKYNNNGDLLWTAFQLDSRQNFLQGLYNIVLDSTGNNLYGFGARGMYVQSNPTLHYYKNIKLNTNSGILIDSVSFYASNSASVSDGRGTIDRTGNRFLVGNFYYMYDSQSLPDTTVAGILTVKYSSRLIPNSPSIDSLNVLSDKRIKIFLTDNSVIETGFKVQRSSDNGNIWNTIATLPKYDGYYPYKFNYTDSTVVGSAQFCYKVLAFNTNGDSPFSNSLCATTFPSAPSNLTAVSSQGPDYKISLNWLDNAAGETGYEIQRKLGTAGEYAQIAVLGANATSFLDTTLPVPIPGATYSYRIRAFDSAGNSEWSNVAVVQLVNIFPTNEFIPSEYFIKQNYPNPFNPETTIEFGIIKTGPVSIKIYDISGKEIASLVNNTLIPGYYKTEWNAVNYSSGMYFIKIIVGDFVRTKKMLLIK